MAFDSAIKAFFGGDTSGLRAAISEAGAELDKFGQRAGKQLEHKAMGALFGIELLRNVQEFAKQAIDAAQKTRDELEKLGKPIDNATRTLAAFGDGLDQIKQSAVSLTGAVLSQFTQFGDHLGSIINRIRGVSKEVEDDSEASSRRLRDRMAAEAKFRAENSPEKVAEAEKRLAQAREQSATAGMSAIEKLTYLRTRQLEIEKTIAATGASTVAHYDAQTESVKNLAEIERTRAQVVADQNRETQKNAQEMQRLNDRKAEIQDRENQRAFDQLAAEDRLALLEQRRLGIIGEINRYGKDSAVGVEDRFELEQLETKILQTNLELAASRVDAEREAAAVVKERAASAERGSMGGFSGDRGTMKLLGGLRHYFDPIEQRREEQMVIRSETDRIKEQIKQLEERKRTYGMDSLLGKADVPVINERIKGLEERLQHVDQYVYGANYSDRLGKGILAQQIETVGGPTTDTGQSNEYLKNIRDKIAETNSHLAGLLKNT